MKSNFLAIIIGVLSFSSVMASAENISFTCATDKPPVTYKPGEPMVFTIQMLENDKPIAGRKLTWTRRGDDQKNETGEAISSDTHPLVIATSSDKPGFVHIAVSVLGEDGKPLKSKGQEVKWEGGAAVQPEKLASVPEPNDFDAFWVRQKAKLKAVPVSATMQSVPSGNPQFEVFDVKVDCPGGKPVSGYLTKPKGAAAKSLVAQVGFLGYGVGSSHQNCEKETLTFTINAHGIENGKDPEYYNGLQNGELNRYAFNSAQNADPEVSYFNGMMLRVMRSLEFIKSQPEWNGKELSVIGGSQGGLQALTAAGLDPDVTRCLAFKPWCCDLGGATLNRVSGWRPDWVYGLGYFDPVNHAKRIHCEIYLNAGLGDYTCPPSGIAVLYNNISAANKKIEYLQGATHALNVHSGMAAERVPDDGTPDKVFFAPTHEAKPWVYWWFQGGYGDPQGMARDLEEMKAKGIGGVMHMQTLNSGGLPLPKEPRMLSPDWDAWFGEALRLAHEEGLTFSASIIDGWGHGGGWVGKEDGAKQLVHAEMQVDGPGPISDPLPLPPTQLGVYHEVAVVAFREPATQPPVPLQVRGSDVIGGYCAQEYWPAAHAVDSDPESFVRMSRPAAPDNPLWVEATYARPITATGAFIAGMAKAGPAACELQHSDDGKSFTPVIAMSMAPGEQKRVTFAPVTARVFRLVITQAHAPDLQLAEFQMLRQGDEPRLRPGIKDWDLKSANVGGGWGGWPANLYLAMEDEYVAPEASDVAAKDVVDLSAHLQPDGRLDWTFPEGRWTVMRFGWTPVAEPARMSGGGGYEVDVLNVKGAELMMAQPAKRMRELSVKHAGGAPVIFHTDSWEIGAGRKGQQPTWTDDFRAQFKQRRGYDLLPYLPAMARRLVDSRDTTGRFLSDYRNTVSDLLTAYYGRLQELAHDMNGGINSESGYGSFPHPHMDGLEVFGRSDRPMAEFWHPYGEPTFCGDLSSAYLHEIDVMRTAASGARIYGNRFVQAETLTFHPTAGLWTPPTDYRKTLHAAWTRGLNQTVIHKYTHQPMEGKPGLLDLDIFNRHFSWWPLADGFMGYMARTQHLLQQGDFVADAAYFVGEGASRFVPGKEWLVPALPDSYDYDGINAEVLKTRARVQDGRLVLPPVAAAPGVEAGAGPSYRYLVLSDPQCSTMTVATLARIRELVQDGLTLVGKRPLRTPGLGDMEAMECQLKEHADALWGATPGASGERTVGKGRVLWGTSMQDIFAKDGVLPDVEYRALGAASAPEISLRPAAWIWHAEDGVSPQAVTRYFKKGFELAAGSKVRSARARLTADNAFQLQVNGKELCSGDDWLTPVTVDVSASLHEGANEIRIRAVNTIPGAAGLVFRLVLELADGKMMEIVSDATWESSQEGETWAPVAQLGAYGSAAPWSAFQKPDSVPVLDFLHRTVPGKEIYYLANQSGVAVDLAVTLRAKGSVVQRFDPLDGAVRELPEKTRGADGRLTVPLHFEKDQAFFLVIGEGSQSSEAGVQRSEKNIPELKEVQEVAGPWTVTFDAAWVKPLPPGTPAGAKEVSLSFPVLTDWTQRAEDGIKAYGGVATYRTMLPLPPGMDQSSSLQLDLGTVKEMARVELNGRDLGVVWCPPWRVTIPPGLLKPAENSLVITVANLWSNRLAADASLPDGERLTQVGHGMQQAMQQRGLQSSGLLGPVRIMAEKQE